MLCPIERSRDADIWFLTALELTKEMSKVKYALSEVEIYATCQNFNFQLRKNQRKHKLSNFRLLNFRLSSTLKLSNLFRHL